MDRPRNRGRDQRDDLSRYVEQGAARGGGDFSAAEIGGGGEFSHSEFVRRLLSADPRTLTQSFVKLQLSFV